MKAKDSFSILGFHVLTAIKCDNFTIFKLLHIDLPLCSRILDLCFTTHGRHHCSHFMDDESELAQVHRDSARNLLQVCLLPSLGSRITLVFISHSWKKTLDSVELHKVIITFCYLTAYWSQGWFVFWCLPVADPTGPSRSLSVTTWDWLAEASGSNTV